MFSWCRSRMASCTMLLSPEHPSRICDLPRPTDDPIRFGFRSGHRRFRQGSLLDATQRGSTARGPALGAVPRRGPEQQQGSVARSLRCERGLLPGRWHSDRRGASIFHWPSSPNDRRIPVTPQGDSGTPGVWYGSQFSLRPPMAAGKAQEVVVMCLDYDLANRSRG